MSQFAIWEVKGNEYKMKLRTSSTCELEEKLGESLINVLSSGMPTLNIMLTIAHAAMKEWNNGIKRSDVVNLFDDYIEEGGSQLEFFSKQIMEIYKVSGFFSQAQTEKMEKKQAEAQELLE